MNEDKIKELLSDTIEKLRRTEENDVKVANEMSNTLNWLVTFTTLFFGFMIDNEVSNFCLKNELYLTYKIVFISLITILITYKMVFKEYELTKKDILNLLDTHYIELKNNLIHLKSKMNEKHDFFVNFINSFRNGEFLPNGNEERKTYLEKQYRKLKPLGWIIKWFYFIAIILFIINFLITIVFVLKN